MAKLLETTDVAQFIHSSPNRLDLSFLPQILAPLYYYKANLLGWAEYTVDSDNPRLKGAFRKLQKTKSSKHKLFLSITQKEDLLKKKILSSMNYVIYLIDSSSF